MWLIKLLKDNPRTNVKVKKKIFPDRYKNKTIVEIK